MSEAPVQTDFLELDLRRYELRRGSSVLKLEKIPMELLILLVERRDQLLGREEIIARLWGKDVFLDTVAGLRADLDDVGDASVEQPGHRVGEPHRRAEVVHPVRCVHLAAHDRLDPPRVAVVRDVVARFAHGRE